MALQPAHDRDYDPVLYFPRVSHSIVEHLEFHLNRCSEFGDDGIRRLKPVEPYCDGAVADPQRTLTPLDLQSALTLIEQAGVAIDELRRLPAESTELLDSYEVVSALQQRMLSQEREIDQMSEDLLDARAQIATSARRAEVAETRLQSIMSMLGKIISPYVRRKVFDADVSVDRQEGPLRMGEVEA